MKRLMDYITEARKITHDKKKMKFSTDGGELTYYSEPITIGTHLDAFELETIQVEKSQRNNGIGKELVKAFIEYAKSQKKDIVLYASVLDISDDRMSDEDLIKWYKSLGFKQLDGSDAATLWYDHKNPVKESLMDNEDDIMDNAQGKIILNTVENILSKGLHHRNKKYPTYMFGREIKVGDVCFAYVIMEFHMIQIKEIVEYDGGYFDLIPTVDYKNLDGRGLVNPACCILVPKNQYANFLKIVK